MLMLAALMNKGELTVKPASGEVAPTLPSKITFPVPALRVSESLPAEPLFTVLPAKVKLMAPLPVLVSVTVVTVALPTVVVPA